MAGVLKKFARCDLRKWAVQAAPMCGGRGAVSWQGWRPAPPAGANIVASVDGLVHEPHSCPPPCDFEAQHDELLRSTPSAVSCSTWRSRQRLSLPVYDSCNADDPDGGGDADDGADASGADDDQSQASSDADSAAAPMPREEWVYDARVANLVTSVRGCWGRKYRLPARALR
jgi:hypothetical protein